MRTQSWILNLAAAAMALPAIVFASAQEPQKQFPQEPAESTQGDQSDSKIICRVFLPAITVSVTDDNNGPIPDLGHEDFAIFEDDVKQDIAFWFHDDSSVSYSLAFDVSDYEPLKLMARQAAWGLVRQIRSADDVAIPQLKFDSGTIRAEASDKRKLENALAGISSKNQLAGLVAETVKFARENSKDPRGAAVVITDGRSLSGAASDRESAYEILRIGTPVYFIILDDGRYITSPAVQSRVRRTRGLLTRLAAATGGLALVVKSENEISAATEQIIHRLKSQYTMGFAPVNSKFDGSFRHLRVTVTPKDKRKVKVFAPSGYYSVDPEKIREENFNDR